MFMDAFTKRTFHCAGTTLLPVVAALWFWVASVSGQTYREQVEADWLRQAAALGSAGAGAQDRPANVPTWADAAGAVDGVKDGKYAFHTDRQPNPWWQVDLRQPVPIGRIVVYNRLDYALGLHNADTLLVLASDEGKTWRRVHENQGKHFGGVSGAPPLDVTFPAGNVKARFVRLTIPSPQPIWFHLDEVEVFGPDDPKKNLALRRRADQSSISQWSTAKPQATPPGGIPDTAAFPTRQVIDRARLLAADLAADLAARGADVRPFEQELDRIAATLEKPPADADLVRRLTEVHARRCAACHKSEEVTRVDWIDLKQPERSPFLAAPLSKPAGGLGRCGKPVYNDRDDPDYRAALGLVQATVEKARQQPRRDVRALADRR